MYEAVVKAINIFCIESVLKHYHDQNMQQTFVFKFNFFK